MYMSRQLDTLTNRMEVFETSAISDHERIRKLERKVRDLEQINKVVATRDGPTRRLAESGETKRRRSPSPSSTSRRDRHRSRSPAVRRLHASPERRVHVNNFKEVTDARAVESLLLHDLSQFGQLVDIYVDPSLKWANVTFKNAGQAQNCLRLHESMRSLNINCHPYHETTKR